MTKLGRFRTKKIKGFGQSGFTLVELCLVIVILSVLSIGVMLFMNPLMDLAVHKNFMNGPAIEGRLALKRMVREINQIRDPESVLTASGNQFSFINTDGQTITYTVNAGSLLRNNVNLAKSITSLQFTYWDAQNNVLVSPTISPETNILRIQTSLTVTFGPESATFRSQMRPRNLL